MEVVQDGVGSERRDGRHDGEAGRDGGSEALRAHEDVLAEQGRAVARHDLVRRRRNVVPARVDVPAGRERVETDSRDLISRVRVAEQVGRKNDLLRLLDPDSSLVDTNCEDLPVRKKAEALSLRVRSDSRPPIWRSRLVWDALLRSKTQRFTLAIRSLHIQNQHGVES